MKNLNLFLLILISSAISLQAEEILNSLIDYSKYGELKKIGQNGFHYRISDKNGLKKLTYPGLYPFKKISHLSEFRDKIKKGDYEKNPWKALSLPFKDAYLSWVMCHESEGIKQFFISSLLMKEGKHLEALKGFYSIIIHFSRDYCYSSDGSFVWYLAPAARSMIFNILRMNPQWNITYIDSDIEMTNCHDLDPLNDIIIVNPGSFIKAENKTKEKILLNVKGQGKIKIKCYSDFRFELTKDNKPYYVRGVSYHPTKVGRAPGDRLFSSWMFEDSDKNGLADTVYDSYIDFNKNNQKDSGEKAEGDFSIMKKMGINTVRIFPGASKDGYQKNQVNKEALRDIYKEHGISFIMGDFCGAYTMSSGASWEDGTDYNNPEHRKNILNSVKKMVMDLKDEEFVLLWLLGNENELPSSYDGVNATRTNAGNNSEAYLSLIEEAAQMIHEIDPDHPVMIGCLLDTFAEKVKVYAPSIDIFGVNKYNTYGFGSLFEDIKQSSGLPVIITEYGADAYEKEKGVNEEKQSENILNCLEDLQYNSIQEAGAGNVLGGIMFEWMDEWWKDTRSGDSAANQQTKHQAGIATFDGASHEEWYGLFGQGDGKNSPFLRTPRKIYYELIKRDNIC